MIGLAGDWKDYEVIETGDGMKLERFGSVTLLRPDPQIIWGAPFDLEKYPGLNAVYRRSKSGGGSWEYLKRVPEEFNIGWRDLKFSLKLMGFKHTGIFPEQAYNWAKMRELIAAAARSGRVVKVLNLFAYTGGASVACAKEGAEVTHVDAAKAMCERAGKNAVLSGLGPKAMRYIVDDCMKFVEREIRRGNRYDAVIMDPPSYGRGPKGEIWKLEDTVFDFVKRTVMLLSDNPLFFLINSYTTGLQPTVMKNIIDIALNGTGSTEAYELALPTGRKNVVLPSGASAFTHFE